MGGARASGRGPERDLLCREHAEDQEYWIFELEIMLNFKVTKWGKCNSGSGRTATAV